MEAQRYIEVTGEGCFTETANRFVAEVSVEVRAAKKESVLEIVYYLHVCIARHVVRNRWRFGRQPRYNWGRYARSKTSNWSPQQSKDCNLRIVLLDA